MLFVCKMTRSPFPSGGIQGTYNVLPIQEHWKQLETCWDELIKA
jgi:hypothetical protein